MSYKFTADEQVTRMKSGSPDREPDVCICTGADDRETGR